MVDSKFLIITTLCYVGIFVVVLVVCCCAWSRYMRNEGKFSPRSAKQRARRPKREPNIEPPQDAIPLPPRQEYRYIGDFIELDFHSDGLRYEPELRSHGKFNRQPYPVHNHPNYSVPLVGFPPRTYYPASLATGTCDYDPHMELGSYNTYGETSLGGLSGDDDYSDFQSSRFDTDSRPEVVTSDGVGCGSLSDHMRGSNNIIEINGLGRPGDCLPVPTNTINHDSDYEDDDDDDDLSVQSSSDMLPPHLDADFREACDGAGTSPPCSVQSLSRNVSEQSLTEVNQQ
ncbi:uncharacterized protein LOC116603975 [Nematostella vectensis]|uniref:uncharacterized protein LOC116603975 n=1 Tax=Nematostella vectensis TaxID=45351 RepID=UPI002076ED51|nr:uncharacterized protein LOC116603975 [Nematostella vectensis]